MGDYIDPELMDLIHLTMLKGEPLFDPDMENVRFCFPGAYTPPVRDPASPTGTLSPEYRLEEGRGWVTL